MRLTLVAVGLGMLALVGCGAGTDVDSTSSGLSSSPPVVRCGVKDPNASTQAAIEQDIASSAGHRRRGRAEARAHHGAGLCACHHQHERRGDVSSLVPRQISVLNAAYKTLRA